MAAVLQNQECLRQMVEFRGSKDNELEARTRFLEAIVLGHAPSGSTGSLAELPGVEAFRGPSMERREDSAAASFARCCQHDGCFFCVCGTRQRLKRVPGASPMLFQLRGRFALGRPGGDCLVAARRLGPSGGQGGLVAAPPPPGSYNIDFT
ncbi:unnamed protein product, partial [Prorocentrum cordatum]